MNILSFGEILWDHIGDGWYIGGAPFNLAAHCARMGASATLVSSVGDDDLGRNALAEARENGIETRLIRVNRQLPTGTVEITFRDDGFHDFTIHDNVAWDDIAVSPGEARALGAGVIDALCFGTLAQRSAVNRSSLESLVDGAAPRAVFYDVNIRQNYYAAEWIEWSLRACTIMKCNDDEAALLAGLLFGSSLNEEEFARSAAERYNITTLCITRGRRGAAVLHDGTFIEVPGVTVNIADTVGAGDAFSAAFLRSFLAGHEAGASARFAVRVGAFVASRSGAVPEYSGEITAVIASMAG
jgi:fructokinase